MGDSILAVTQLNNRRTAGKERSAVLLILSLKNNNTKYKKYREEGWTCDMLCYQYCVPFFLFYVYLLSLFVLFLFSVCLLYEVHT